MRRFVCAMTVVLAATGCGSDAGGIGLDGGARRPVSHDAFVTGLASRVVGGGAGVLDTVPVVFVTEVAGSTVPTLGVQFAPGRLRSSTGEVVPDVALTAGRKVRVWTQAPLVIAASDPAFVTADSVIVLD